MTRCSNDWLRTSNQKPVVAVVVKNKKWERKQKEKNEKEKKNKQTRVDDEQINILSTPIDQ